MGKMEIVFAIVFISWLLLKVRNHRKRTVRKEKKEERSILIKECFPNDNIQQPTL